MVITGFFFFNVFNSFYSVSHFYYHRFSSIVAYCNTFIPAYIVRFHKIINRIEYVNSWRFIVANCDIKLNHLRYFLEVISNKNRPICQLSKISGHIDLSCISVNTYTHKINSVLMSLIVLLIELDAVTLERDTATNFSQNLHPTYTQYLLHKV